MDFLTWLNKYNIEILAILWVLLNSVICFYFLYGKATAKDEINKIKEDYEHQISEVKKNAKNASRRVIKGKVSEELAPLMPNFPFLASDVKFIGSPIDCVIFKNMTEIRDGENLSNEQLEIVFVDYKTGNARLTKVQKQIKEAVEAGRISWKTIRITEEGILND